MDPWPCLWEHLLDVGIPWQIRWYLISELFKAGDFADVFSRNYRRRWRGDVIFITISVVLAPFIASENSCPHSTASRDPIRSSVILKSSVYFTGIADNRPPGGHRLVLHRDQTHRNPLLPVTQIAPHKETEWASGRQCVKQLTVVYCVKSTAEIHKTAWMSILGLLLSVSC